MAAVGPSSSSGEKAQLQWQQLPQPSPSQPPASGSNTVPMTEEELDYTSPVPGSSYIAARSPTPPPYSGPSTPAQQVPSPMPQDHDPSCIPRYPGLPVINYRLYRPPLFDLSADKTTIKTTAAHFSSNAAALVALIRQQATVPPKPQIRIVGRRQHNPGVDFDLRLNLLPLLVPDDPKQRMDYLRCVGPGELAYRGGTKPSIKPDLEDGGGGGGRRGSSGGSGLEAWAARYVADSASVKAFVLERVLVNLDADWIEGQIRKLIVSMRYPGSVSVTFPTTHTRVVVQNPDKVNKFLTSVAGFFAGKRRYEVVKAVWPFATMPRGSDPGDEGRRCAVQSEETWWREWREPIRYAIASKRVGWVTNEDKLEIIMEGWAGEVDWSGQPIQQNTS
ncbi:hypothetical protein VTJ49DRAFT_337 [Mycothermus thermophilus]|uniref:Uncharacterized protein n=1 Tax=Humicola insolens TaxID=85995 RepID=A0ABR3VFB6_HUMIN